MIIARAPFRITLGGGGTDLPSFYSSHGGFIFAMGIDKYINVLVNPSVVDRRIRLQYLQSEITDNVAESATRWRVKRCGRTGLSRQWRLPASPTFPRAPVLARPGVIWSQSSRRCGLIGARRLRPRCWRKRLATSKSTFCTSPSESRTSIWPRSAVFASSRSIATERWKRGP